MAGERYPSTVFVLGTERNIGKTVTCVGIISKLLSPEHGRSIHEIGYMKPVGQQTVQVQNLKGATLDVDKDAVLLTTLLGVQCGDYESLSPVVWRSGTSASFIDAAASGDPAVRREAMLAKIRAAYERVAQGRRVVLVEGTGQPGVGSVAGVSNADVINTLRAMGVPLFLVLVAPGGIGSTIDEIFPDLMTLDHLGTRLDGLIINGVIPDKMDKVRSYLERYYTSVFPRLYGERLIHQGPPPILGFVPTIDELRLPSMRLVAETLAEDPQNQVETVAPHSLDQASQLVRKCKVVSLSYGYEALVNPGDAVVVGVNSNDVIRSLLSLHRRMARKHGAGLSGLILSCANVGGLSPRTRHLIDASKLPTIMLHLDSAEIVQRIEGMTVKIQPYDLAKRDLIARAYGQYLTLWPHLSNAH